MWTLASLLFSDCAFFRAQSENRHDRIWHHTWRHQDTDLVLLLIQCLTCFGWPTTLNKKQRKLMHVENRPRHQTHHLSVGCCVQISGCPTYVLEEAIILSHYFCKLTWSKCIKWLRLTVNAWWSGIRVVELRKFELFTLPLIFIQINWIKVAWYATLYIRELLTQPM